ncbi:MAG: DUF1059 domain-containing protein [Actinomycetota bacterium]
MTTYELRCVDAGCPSCRGHIQADSEEALKEQVAAHLKDKHGIEVPTATVMDYLVKLAGEGNPPPRT